MNNLCLYLKGGAGVINFENFAIHMSHIVNNKNILKKEILLKKSLRSWIGKKIQD